MAGRAKLIACAGDRNFTGSYGSLMGSTAKLTSYRMSRDAPSQGSKLQTLKVLKKGEINYKLIYICLLLQLYELVSPSGLSNSRVRKQSQGFGN